jgi:hypothetical protein
MPNIEQVLGRIRALGYTQLGSYSCSCMNRFYRLWFSTVSRPGAFLHSHVYSNKSRHSPTMYINFHATESPLSLANNKLNGVSAQYHELVIKPFDFKTTLTMSSRRSRSPYGVVSPSRSDSTLISYCTDGLYECGTPAGAKQTALGNTSFVVQGEPFTTRHCVSTHCTTVPTIPT